MRRRPGGGSGRVSLRPAGPDGWASGRLMVGEGVGGFDALERLRAELVAGLALRDAVALVLEINEGLPSVLPKSVADRLRQSVAAFDQVHNA